MRAAEIFERQSKLKGRARGALGYTGLASLRVLLYRYSRPGRITSPCYATLERVTGLSRGAVCEALKRLQASKLLVVVRRIVRRQVERISPWTGLPEMYVGTLQARQRLSASLAALPRALANEAGSTEWGEKPKQVCKRVVLASRRYAQLRPDPLAAPSKKPLGDSHATILIFRVPR